MPTLVVVGNQDILTPRGDSEELAELIPTAELVVISGAAHGLMVEHASTYNRILLDFLRRAEAAYQERVAAGEPGGDRRHGELTAHVQSRVVEGDAAPTELRARAPWVVPARRPCVAAAVVIGGDLRVPRLAATGTTATSRRPRRRPRPAPATDRRRPSREDWRAACCSAARPTPASRCGPAATTAAWGSA